MNKEEKEAIEYYQDKEMSFTVEYNKSEFLKSLGIEETEEDSFENNQIRFKTLLNLIDKQQKELENSISKDKIKMLKEKIHKELDTNGITRAYQILIDGYFEELLKED